MSIGINKKVLALSAASIMLMLAAISYSQPAVGRTGGGTSAVQKDTLFSEYRGVRIGMAVADVRAKIGQSKEKTQSDSGDQYIFSDSESVQFYYDADHSVNAIMITFTGDVKNAPTAKAVFGEDVPPNDQGMIFKMQRYPKLGYWVSYTRTTGSDQMVNIALGKM